MSDLSSGLLILAKVIRLGSFSAAAKHLGTGRASISKQIAALEKTMGAKILHRTTRQLSLTPLGEELLDQAKTIEHVHSEVNRLREHHQNTPTGLVKISCSSALGRAHLVPALRAFLNSNPGITLNIQFEDRHVDLLKERVDLCVRVGQLQDSGLIARKVGALRWQLLASPEYVKRFGSPKTASDLLKHQCIYYGNEKTHMNQWRFIGPAGEESVTVSGGLIMNDPVALCRMAEQGLGILYIDGGVSQQAVNNGTLINVMPPNYQARENLPVYIVYPARDYIPQRVQVVLDYLVSVLQERLA